MGRMGGAISAIPRHDTSYVFFIVGALAFRKLRAFGLFRLSAFFARRTMRASLVVVSSFRFIYVQPLLKSGGMRRMCQNMTGPRGEHGPAVQSRTGHSGLL